VSEAITVRVNPETYRRIASLQERLRKREEPALPEGVRAARVTQTWSMAAVVRAAIDALERELDVWDRTQVSSKKERGPRKKEE